MGGDFLTFGDRTVSLEGSPLHVGSPQGVSSVRLYGSLNCTLYKYVHFLRTPSSLYYEEESRDKSGLVLTLL